MFSTHAVYDVLKNCRFICSIPETQHRKYKGISILPSNAEHMFISILYICTLREALGRDIARPGCHYVCLCDIDPEAAKELTEGRSNIFCVDTKHDLSWLYCQLNDRYLYLQNWIQSMNDALLHDCDFQVLVDISEDVLRNPVFIQDPAFHLLATTKKYKGSSELQRSYQEKHYHSTDFFNQLESKGRLKIYNTVEGLIVLRDHAMEPFDIIGKKKRKSGIVTLSAGVSCSVTPYSPYYCELVEVFCDYIFLCDERKKALMPNSINKGTSLVQDIIHGEISEPNQIADYSRAAWLPYNGPFYLYRITWGKNENISPDLLEREFRNATGCHNIFFFSKELLILDDCRSSANDALALENTLIISEIAASHHCKCTISEPFLTLAELKKAYDQTRYTLRFVEKLVAEDSKSIMPPLSKKSFAERTVYSYREIFVRSIFEHYSSSGPCSIDNVVFVSALKKLMAFDKEHDRNLVEILYYYICNERNASKTGEQIHMSRNNVLYHIAKAVEIIELPLDEHRIRFGLLIAYNLLGIYF